MLDTPDNDVELAALARKMVALSRNEPPAGTSSYRVVAPQLQYECAVEVAL